MTTPRTEPEAPVAVACVGDVTDECRGWLVEVAEPDGLIQRRQFVLGKGFGSGVRRWTYEGVEWVGLTDDQRSPGVVGTERMYRADTPCGLLRKVSRRRA
jgi:hypothetical protein